MNKIQRLSLQEGKKPDSQFGDIANFLRSKLNSVKTIYERDLRGSGVKLIDYLADQIMWQPDFINELQQKLLGLNQEQRNKLFVRVAKSIKKTLTGKRLSEIVQLPGMYQLQDDSPTAQKRVDHRNPPRPELVKQISRKMSA